MLTQYWNVIIFYVDCLLILLAESYPPPRNIHLVRYSVDPNILTFAWDPLLSNCSTLNYTIISRNCGHCLPPASNNSTVCTDVPVAESPCIFKVRTDVCGRIAGIESAPILVQYQGNFKSLWDYSVQKSELNYILTQL